MVVEGIRVLGGVLEERRGYSDYREQLWELFNNALKDKANSIMLILLPMMISVNMKILLGVKKAKLVQAFKRVARNS